MAHFSANDPHELLAAALLVQDRCDAIDLVLRVPAALPFLLPSPYLTTPMVCAPGRIWGVRSVWRMPGTLAATYWATRTAPSSSTSSALFPKVRIGIRPLQLPFMSGLTSTFFCALAGIRIPMFVKIRLLNTVDETIELVSAPLRHLLPP